MEISLDKPGFSVVTTDAMSVTLLAKFSSMLEDFQVRVNNPSIPDPSAVLGQSATNTEPVSSRPTDRTKCPTGLRFRKGGEDPALHEVNIASDSIIDETPETPHHPLRGYRRASW